jgi:hypothetical protein
MKFIHSRSQEKPPTRKRFTDLNVGEAFKYYGLKYIKTKYVSRYYDKSHNHYGEALCLNRGAIFPIQDSVNVIPCGKIDF